VTLAEAKAWLRVESGDDEDTLIAALIAAARARAEWHTGRAFVTQSWTLWLDRAAPCIEIPLPPLRSVESVTAYAPDGGASVLDAGDYTVDPAAARLLLHAVPFDLRAINALAVAFTAGYGDAQDVPAPIVQAILQILASLYEHRGGDAAPTPDTALALLAPYRMIQF
jgi:uncharacterized phiE125 gp8 family phage protein